MALQMGHSGGLSLSSVDADLQRVIFAWSGLPEKIRKAIAGLADSQP